MAHLAKTSSQSLGVYGGPPPENFGYNGVKSCNSRQEKI